MNYFDDLVQALRDGEKAEDLADLFAKSLSAAEQRVKEDARERDRITLACEILDKLKQYYAEFFPNIKMGFDIDAYTCAEVLDRLAIQKQNLENMNMDKMLVELKQAYEDLKKSLGI